MDKINVGRKLNTKDMKLVVKMKYGKTFRSSLSNQRDGEIGG